jgi:hypothetical protein
MYFEIFPSWGREVHTSCCTVKERSGIAWLRLEIWKLRGVNGRTEGGICSLYAEGKKELHVFLKCPKTQIWI